MFQRLDHTTLATAIREEKDAARGRTNQALCACMRNYRRAREVALDGDRLYDADLYHARLTACESEAAYRFAAMVADGRDRGGEV